MPFPPSFDHTWDLTQPPDTQLLNQGALDFRNLKDDVMQRLSLLSGTLANRPTPEIVNATWGGAGFGLLFFSTDTSQIFQWNGAAWIDITSTLLPAVIGIPAGFVPINLTAQAANIASATVYAIPVGKSGFYRVSGAVILTQTVSVSGTVPSLGIFWTDPVTSATPPTFVLITNTFAQGFVGYEGTTNPSYYGSITIYAKGGTSITYQTNGYVSNGVGPLQYAVSIRLEYLGA